jgi:GntR family transcriptional regulator
MDRQTPETNGLPRYQRLAAILRDQIARGLYPIGSQLPTEQELCETHSVSRHTVRDALRLLREAGQITRKRGAGTLVTADIGKPAYVQPLGGIDDLMQYARDARLIVTLVEQRNPDAAEAKSLGLKRGENWVLIEGLRAGETNGPPVGLTRIWVRADICPSEAEIARCPGAITELIEARSGLATRRISQEISASLLLRSQANALGATVNSAALRTIRRYYDALDRLYVTSDTIHPADRFVYAMTVMRDTASGKPAL